VDIATIVGIVFGIVLLLGSILIEGSLSAFWSVSSLMIVLGGTLASTLINFPLAQVVGTIKIIRIAFRNHTTEPAEIIATLVAFAEKARREGLLALEAEAEVIDEPFLKKGIQLIVDGTDPEFLLLLSFCP